MLKFENPRIDIEDLSVEDVITTSCDGDNPNAGEEDEW